MLFPAAHSNLLQYFVYLNYSLYQHPGDETCMLDS
jgi:hypothetical protein